MSVRWNEFLLLFCCWPQWCRQEGRTWQEPDPGRKRTFPSASLSSSSFLPLPFPPLPPFSVRGAEGAIRGWVRPPLNPHPPFPPFGRRNLRWTLSRCGRTNGKGKREEIDEWAEAESRYRGGEKSGKHSP